MECMEAVFFNFNSVLSVGETFLVFLMGKEKENKKNEKFYFISLGTHPQQFERLLWEVERLVDEGKLVGRVFAQIGHTSYEPKNFEFEKFIEPSRFKRLVEECDVFITHAGEGNIGLAKNLGKKFIAVPRKKEFDEHTDDHQLELARVVEDKKLGLVSWVVWDLEEKIRELENFEPNTVERGRIVEILDEFVEKKLGW